MPIKDITNEEKSNLYMVGKKPKEVQRISESERGILVADITERGSFFTFDSNVQHCAASLLLQFSG